MAGPRAINKVLFLRKIHQTWDIFYNLVFDEYPGWNRCKDKRSLFFYSLDDSFDDFMLKCIFFWKYASFCSLRRLTLTNLYFCVIFTEVSLPIYSFLLFLWFLNLSSSPTVIFLTFIIYYVWLFKYFSLLKICKCNTWNVYSVVKLFEKGLFFFDFILYF